MQTPGLQEVIAFVRHQSAIGDTEPIGAQTCLEADLGVSGDDGSELLLAAENHFSVILSTPDGSLSPLFGLGANEYLFSAEGMDWPLGYSFRWLFNQPTPVMHDLTAGELHAVLVQLRATQQAAT